MNTDKEGFSSDEKMCIAVTSIICGAAVLITALIVLAVAIT